MGWARELRVDAEGDVGARADLEHDAVLGEAVDEGEVLDGADAVADAFGAEVAERVGDALGAAPFARVGGEAEAGLAGDVEGVREVAGLAGLLVARDAEAHEPVAGGFCRAEGGFLGLLRPEVADAGDDAAERDAILAFGLVRRLADGGEVVAPGVDVAAAAEVGRQEGLGVDDAVRRHFRRARRG